MMRLYNNTNYLQVKKDKTPQCKYVELKTIERRNQGSKSKNVKT